MKDWLRRLWHGRPPQDPCADCGLDENTKSVLDELLDRMDKIIAAERQERNIVDRAIWRNHGRGRG